MNAPSSVGGKEWCIQCEQLKAPAAVAACRSAFCKLKTPDPDAPAVTVDPRIIARMERRRALEAGEPVKVDPPTPKPVVKRQYKPRLKPDALTGREQKLLNNMRDLAFDGLVTASFADLEEGVATMPSGVSPVMRGLINKGRVSIVSKPNGRSKTVYRLEGVEAEEAPPPTPKLVQLMQEPSPLEPGEVCTSCRFTQDGACRRYPPTATGWPKTKPYDWCGEWQKRQI